MKHALASLALLLSCQPVGAVAGNPEERTVFRCRSGQTVVSVVRDGDRISYRSTRNGRLEIQVPGGKVARAGYSGGGELQASFVNGPWTYVVYERVVRTSFSGTNDPSFEAGVDVVKNGEVVHGRACSNPEAQFDQGVLDLESEGAFIRH